METPKVEKRVTETQKEARGTRFRIARLEERIAPKKWTYSSDPCGLPWKGGYDSKGLLCGDPNL